MGLNTILLTSALERRKTRVSIGRITKDSANGLVGCGQGGSSGRLRKYRDIFRFTCIRRPRTKRLPGPSLVGINLIDDQFNLPALVIGQHQRSRRILVGVEERGGQSAALKVMGDRLLTVVRTRRRGIETSFPGALHTESMPQNGKEERCNLGHSNA